MRLVDGYSRWELLVHLLTDVVEGYEPQAAQHLRGEASSGELSLRVLARILQAQSIMFQLLAIAEQNRDMRNRRALEAEEGPEAVKGTFAAAIAASVRSGVRPEQIATLLNSIRIRPVITAHPTEARRVTVLECHRRIYRRLYDLESPRWTKREQDELIRSLRDEIEILWLTGELKLVKPSVAHEVAWGLYFFTENLFDVVPQMLASLEADLRHTYPEREWEIPLFFQFGSWIGGDRDGNPFVTSETTCATLWSHRLVSLNRYRLRVLGLLRNLSIAEQSLELSDAFRNTLRARLESLPSGAELVARNAGEPFRQYLSAVLARLDQTIRDSMEQRQSVSETGYTTADELILDLDTMTSELALAGSDSVGRSFLLPLKREVGIFRFCTMRLDVRENAPRMNRALAAIFRDTHGGQEPPAHDSREWKDWLLTELTASREVARDFSQLPADAAETLQTFRTIAQMRQKADREAFGSLVLSMTHSAADVLGVYVMAKEAGLFQGEASVERCTLPVVPLLETIADLRGAARILNELLAVPVVQRSLQEQDGVQEVMVGYSDSNKDGGYFAANWELAKAQVALARLGQDHGVTIAFFHGRGGSVSRGGAPTGRAIAATPAGSIKKSFRVTEQGEVVSLKYSNRGTAAYQVELLAASVMEHALLSEREQELIPIQEFDEAMESLSGLSWTAYQQLVSMDNILEYLTSASPLEELALLNIGSRPTRRTEARTLEDLRAIPWVFAWSQNRHMITGWYGIGSALRSFLEVRGERGADLLKRMFQDSRLFRVILDEVEKTLLAVDMDIARSYADMVQNRALRDSIFDRIHTEYQLTRKMILSITGASEIAERFPQYRRRLMRRLTTLNQVSRQQIDLLRQYRARGDDDVRDALLLTINCASAGLGFVG